jgi:hypothetical protein
VTDLDTIEIPFNVQEELILLKLIPIKEQLVKRVLKQLGVVLYRLK